MGGEGCVSNAELMRSGWLTFLFLRAVFLYEAKRFKFWVAPLLDDGQPHFFKCLCHLKNTVGPSSGRLHLRPGCAGIRSARAFRQIVRRQDCFGVADVPQPLLQLSSFLTWTGRLLVPQWSGASRPFSTPDLFSRGPIGKLEKCHKINFSSSVFFETVINSPR